MASIKDSIIHWTPKDASGHPMAGKVAITPLGYETKPKHSMTWGGCWSWMHDKDLQPGVLKAACFVEAMHLIVRDGVDPQKVHEVFMQVDEYRDGCSDDMPLMSQ